MVEVDGVVDDLVQELFDPEIRDAGKQRMRDAPEDDLPMLLGRLQVADVALEELLHVYDFEFLRLQGLLEIRGVGQILHDGADQHDPALGARQVLARAGGTLVFQVLQRGA